MSHSVNIKTQFKDFETLRAVFELLGWNIENDRTCRTYPTDPTRNQIHRYVAVNPNPSGYDVGIDIDGAGNAVLTCDFYDRSIEEVLGANLKNVKQGYSFYKLKKFMNEEDLNYKVETLESGQLKIIATK